MAQTTKGVRDASGDAQPATWPDEKIVTYRFLGVRYDDADKMPDGGLCVSLKVQPLSVDWEVIETILSQGGVEANRAKHYVEAFVALIETEEMARSIASRLKRLG